MKALALILVITLLSGCSIFKTDETSITQPTLLKRSPMPAIPISITSNEIEIYCEMLIGSDGTVQKAKVIKGSGDKTWDYLAEQSLLGWKYTPAFQDDKPVALLVRRKIKLEFAEPEIIALGEIACSSITSAEQVYKELISGKEFTQLAAKYSVSTSREKGGYVGEVDIHHYCDQIQKVLSGLNEEEFTKPLTYGREYVIFKRLKKENTQAQVKTL